MFSRTLSSTEDTKTKLLKPGYVCHNARNKREAGVFSPATQAPFSPPFYGENDEIKI